MISHTKEARKGFAAVGLVLGPHGTDGSLRVKPFNPSTKYLQTGQSVHLVSKAVQIQTMRESRGIFVITVSGTNTRKKAVQLKGSLLEVPESSLERDHNSWFVHEIEGLEVFGENNQFIGRIEEVLQPGANDVYMIKNGDREILIPATKEVIEEINLESGIVRIRLKNYPIALPPSY